MSLIISFFCFFFGLVVLCGSLCHFLRVLLIFELFTFGLFCWVRFFFACGFNSVGCYFCLIFLVLRVVEAVVGFSLLVRGSRGLGRVGVKGYSFMGV